MSVYMLFQSHQKKKKNQTSLTINLRQVSLKWSTSPLDIKI